MSEKERSSKFDHQKKADSLDDSGMAKPAVAVAVKPVEKIVLRAVHDFHWPDNGQVIPFKKDQIISDVILVRNLLENNAPVKRVEESIDFHCCPKCHTQF